MRATCKLTPQVHAKIVDLLREGAPIEPASRACRVTPSTLRRWISNGRAALAKAEDGGDLDEHEDGYAAFTVDADQAIAEFELDMLRQCRDAKAGVWQRDMTVLERRFPDRWSQSRTLVVEQEAGDPNPGEFFGDASPGQLVELAEAL